ncbi:MAG: sigma-70 family RNA polymerase sigma factor [Agarilytica sp.]
MSRKEASALKENTLVQNLFADCYCDLKRYISLKFGSKNDAEDIVQDAFQNILGNGSLEHIQNPKAYLYQAAQNLALNRIRKEKRHLAFQEKCFHAEQAHSPDREVTAGKALEKIQISIASLPEKPRKAFELSRVHHKTYREISEELGVSESSVEKYIIQTLRILRDNIG